MLRAFRLALGVIGAVAAAVGVVVAIYFGWNWLTFDRHFNSVVAGARMESGKACATEFPLAVAIGNRSSKTLKRAIFQIEAYALGRSSNLFYSGDRIDSDFIMAPHTNTTSCWSLTTAQAKTIAETPDISFSLKLLSVEFE